MDGILFVLRTGCQWNALNETGICSSSTAHSRFQEWVKAGVFLKLWKMALKDYDELKGIDWSWQSMDGAMTKAPLGGGKNRPKPYGIIGFAIQKYLMGRAFGISMEAPLIIAFGISLILQNLAQIIWSPMSRGLTTSYALGSFSLGGAIVPTSISARFYCCFSGDASSP